MLLIADLVALLLESRCVELYLATRNGVLETLLNEGLLDPGIRDDAHWVTHGQARVA